MDMLANPTVFYLLILGVIAGIYLEVAHPGTIFPSVVAVVCLIFAWKASRVLPVNPEGLLLILGAIGFLIAEIFVTSFGLLTVAALVCFFLGSQYLFDPAEGDLRVPLGAIIGATGALGAIGLIVGFFAAKGIRAPQRTGREELVGLSGKVLDPISPGKPGRVFVHGEYWNATAGEEIPAGEKIVVTSIKGLTLTVKQGG